MLKIKRRKGREWARLFLKALFAVNIFYVMFGVVFGIERGVGKIDGDLVLFCRVCRNYGTNDLLLMDSGDAVMYDNAKDGIVKGKIIARVCVRGLAHEVD